MAIRKITTTKTSKVKKFFPRIDPTVPYEVKRHLQLIYEKLNNHAEAFGIVASNAAAAKTTVEGGGGGGGTVVVVPPSPPALPNAVANNILLGSGNTGAGLPYAELTLGTNLAMVGTTLNVTVVSTVIAPFGVTFDGGGSVPTAPIMRLIEIPFNCTITSWTVTADVAGNCSVDLWFLAGSAPPVVPPVPTVANKISAAAPIVLAAAQSASGGSAAISTWSPLLTQWGVLAFNLNSVATCKWISVQIQCTRT